MRSPLRSAAVARRFLGLVVGVSFIASALLSASAPACTGITLRPKDGSVVFGRTLEFGVDLQSNVLVIPRGTKYVGTTNNVQKPASGLAWASKYDVIGANAFGMPITIDGLNERGLHVGLFYFPGFAKYHNVAPADADRSLAPWELGIYLLGTCADAKEAVAAVEQVLVGAVVQKEMGFVPPVHYIVTDAAGSSFVIEYIDGALKLYPNPLGVMSNSPPFDWHMTNLGNYVTISDKNVGKLDLAGGEIKSLGQGSGMLGLPGDFTPPSRFVRAVAFSKTALPVDTAQAGVLQAFHILNQFDIPKGSTRQLEAGKEVAEYTIWTSAADLKNLRYYFRTFDNSRIRMVDLRTIVLDSADIRTISMQGEEQIEDVTNRR
ncbi:MAG: choloylglycine hydrolase family protein [Planctomycetia bacterium]|nr:choloylglycine hydrolase family protein [Planctomycetia bacterium]